MHSLRKAKQIQSDGKVMARKIAKLLPFHVSLKCVDTKSVYMRIKYYVLQKRTICTHHIYVRISDHGPVFEDQDLLLDCNDHNNQETIEAAVRDILCMVMMRHGVGLGKQAW